MRDDQDQAAEAECGNRKPLRADGQGWGPWCSLPAGHTVDHESADYTWADSDTVPRLK